MKKLSLALSALVATASLAAVTVSAAEPGRRHAGPPIERLAAQLELDDTQKAEVQRIFQEHRAKLEADRKQRQEELRQQLATVLSAEQMQKLDELREQRKGRHGMRRWKHRGDGHSPSEQPSRSQ
jgi:Spy/CpxP family protein refolding chaperone